ncbi:MAG: ATP-binding cassette domain-containing protein [Planctomycetota bacterium]
MILVQHLTKRFDTLVAIDNLSLAVEEGEIFGLVGPDGAGKTTMMRLLTSIMDPDGGEAWVAGHHVVREAEAVKAEIGYMSQRFGLYADLTVMENLDFYADIYNVPRKGRDERIGRLLAFSNLTPFKRRLAGNLSGGMKQKLGLACTLVHTPRVLFLDEPTNGVDPVSRRDFWRILYQLLREKVTIFVSTAYLDEAERCNRLALIHQGRMLACGTPDEVKQLMRGTILEIRTAEPRQAAAVLRQQFPAASVGLFGDRVHFVSTDDQNEAEHVGKTLRNAGLPPQSVRTIPPTLEDVFVSAIGTKERTSLQSTLPHPLPLSQKGRGEPIAVVDNALPENGGARCALPTLQPDVLPRPVAVVVDKLERRFGSFMAVNRVSFEVNRGEIFGFLGPNGAGKSTTIRMLCGILAPTGGRGSVAGFDIHTQPEEIKANVGYMSQKFSLYQDLTVEENIDFYAGIYRIGAKEKAERKQWVIEMSGLEGHRHRPTAILSGGWKQRLALGCAILHRPPILFLDEPTSGVDPISRRQFWDLIYQLSSEGVTVFVTTHYMDEAEYCDRLALIYRGELIAQGTPEKLKQEAMQEDVLEVVCERPEAAMEALAGLVSVKEVALFGNSLHLVADDGDRAAAETRSRLAEQGFRVQQIERIVPSLEDVFVSLIEARDRAEQPQEEVRR